MGLIARHPPLLTQLPGPLRRSLLGTGAHRAYADGEELISEGDESTFVIAILSGWVAATVTTSRGAHLILAIRGQDDIVGELAAIDGRRRSTSVVSIGLTEAVVVPGVAFRHFLEEQPQATFALLRSVAARLRDSDAERRALVSYTVVQRLARRIADLADGGGVPLDDEVAIDLRLPQHALAASIGATREGLARALRVLRESGAVRTGPRRVAVVRRDLLDLLGRSGDDIGTTA